MSHSRNRGLIFGFGLGPVLVSPAWRPKISTSYRCPGVALLAVAGHVRLLASDSRHVAHGAKSEDEYARPLVRRTDV
jgi:hypothetical protein